MRIIEPHTISTPKKSNRPAIVVVVIVILICALLIAYGVFRHQKPSHTAKSAIIGTLVEGSPYRYFTDDDFQVLTNTVKHPNTQPIGTPLSITGNVLADNRIRKIAESRGYMPQPVPAKPLANFESFALQPQAITAWNNLSRNGLQSHITLRLQKASISPTSQQLLFEQALKDHAVSTNQIVKGAADTIVETIMQDNAVPGYSPLQTGYAVEISCTDKPADFAQSNCYHWLQSDNYMHAKQDGWIPTDPETLTATGVKKSSQEYIWVGQDALKN